MQKSVNSPIKNLPSRNVVTLLEQALQHSKFSVSKSIPDRTVVCDSKGFLIRIDETDPKRRVWRVRGFETPVNGQLLSQACIRDVLSEVEHHYLGFSTDNRKPFDPNFHIGNLKKQLSKNKIEFYVAQTSLSKYPTLVSSNETLEGGMPVWQVSLKRSNRKLVVVSSIGLLNGCVFGEQIGSKQIVERIQKKLSVTSCRASDVLSRLRQTWQSRLADLATKISKDPADVWGQEVGAVTFNPMSRIVFGPNFSATVVGRKLHSTHKAYLKIVMGNHHDVYSQHTAWMDLDVDPYKLLKKWSHQSMEMRKEALDPAASTSQFIPNQPSVASPEQSAITYLQQSLPQHEWSVSGFGRFLHSADKRILVSAHTLDGEAFWDIMCYEGKMATDHHVLAESKFPASQIVDMLRELNQK